MIDLIVLQDAPLIRGDGQRIIGGAKLEFGLLRCDTWVAIFLTKGSAPESAPEIAMLFEIE